MPPDATFLIRGGLVFDTAGRSFRAADVRCRGGRIEAVVPPGEGGAADTVLDAGGAFVLPGLIDCHVHLSMEFSADFRLRSVQESPTDAAMHAVA